LLSLENFGMHGLVHLVACSQKEELF
jgi:hypothetical protein